MPITEALRARALDLLAPDDAPVYFALFSDTEASVELDAPGYARVEYFSGWLDGGGTRVNAAAVEWAPMQADMVVRSAGFFDASEGGTLLGWSRTRALQGDEVELVVAKGEVCAVPVGAVRVAVSSG